MGYTLNYRQCQQLVVAIGVKRRWERIRAAFKCARSDHLGFVGGALSARPTTSVPQLLDGLTLLEPPAPTGTSSRSPNSN